MTHSSFLYTWLLDDGTSMEQGVRNSNYIQWKRQRKEEISVAPPVRSIGHPRCNADSSCSQVAVLTLTYSLNFDNFCFCHIPVTIEKFFLFLFIYCIPLYKQNINPDDRVCHRFDWYFLVSRRWPRYLIDPLTLSLKKKKKTPPMHAMRASRRTMRLFFLSSPDTESLFFLQCRQPDLR